jgi:hypothetical protein
MLEYPKPPFRHSLFQRDSNGKIMHDSTNQPIISQPWLVYFGQIASNAIDIESLATLAAFEPEPIPDTSNDILQDVEVSREFARSFHRDIEELKSLAWNANKAVPFLRYVDDLRMIAEHEPIDRSYSKDIDDLRTLVEHESLPTLKDSTILEVLLAHANESRKPIPRLITGNIADIAKYVPVPDLTVYHMVETGTIDSDAYYVARNGTWHYAEGLWEGTYANRPDPDTDLGAQDDGLLYLDSTYDITWKFDYANTRWRYESGRIESTLANIPATSPADLDAEDDGTPFWATDFKHTWIWSGTAWEWEEKDEGSGFIQLRATDPVTGYWHVCDGATVDRSNNDGSVTSITLPDYSTAAYLKLGTSASLTPDAASGATSARIAF